MSNQQSTKSYSWNTPANTNSTFSVASNCSTGAPFSGLDASSVEGLVGGDGCYFWG